MRVADALAVTQRGVSALVDAAGTSVGLEAKQLLGTVYGRRVAVLVGPGLNGADGRVAGQWLAARGARVDVFEVARQPGALRGFDLVIDAAFGLGCTRPYVAPRLGGATLVLAVDLPSGVEADSGKILGAPLVADVTLALGALKAAHLSGPASSFVGELRFASLGIVSSFVDGLIEDSDLNELITVHRDDNKWTHAVQVIAGSTLMPGAAWMVASGALAGGASMIRLASRGEAPNLMALPPEVVRVTESAVDRRSRAVVAGPGLGADASAWLRERLLQVQVPVVLDADGLHRDLLPGPRAPQHRWILTPHEGEFTRLTGQALGEDRIGDVRTLARETGCVVLLKGSTTILADPTGTL